MTRYVALLRGIGPGNPNMRNDKLRGVLKAMGFTDVGSVISSGNIVFESQRKDVARMEAQIEEAIPKMLGFTSTTIIRSRDDIQKLINKNPFAKHTHNPKTSLNVTFLKRKPASAITPPTGEHYSVKAVYPRELCAIIDTTQSKTPDYMAKVEKLYGKQITTRSWKTVGRIYAKLQ